MDAGHAPPAGRAPSTGPGARARILPPLLSLILALLLLPTIPEAAPAQVLGVSASGFPDMRDDLPGGRGVHGWITAEPLGFLRIGVSAGRDLGRESGAGTTCTSYWPWPEGCVEEAVEWRNTVTSASANLLVLGPAIAGFRLGAGPTAAFHHFRVRREGATTGREEEPVLSNGDHRQPALGWMATLDFPSFLGEWLRLRASLERTEVEFRSCVADTWSLCGQEHLTRFTLGAGVRLSR